MFIAALLAAYSMSGCTNVENGIYSDGSRLPDTSATPQESATLPTATTIVDGEMIRGATNPILDSHWYEALLLIIPAMTLAGDTWGLGKWWSTTPLVQKNPWLR